MGGWYSLARMIAVVTGASAGIGAEIARQLARDGVQVLAVARRAERLEALGAEMKKVPGAAAIHSLAIDVTTDGAAETIRARAESLGPVTWLVNNAGSAQFGHFEDGDPGAHRQEIRLNCESLVALTRAILPGMLARKSGRVLNVASSAGFQPTPFMSVYGATKAFVISFTEGVSEEIRGSGVTITALCPGPVTTEIFDAGAPGVARKKPPHEISAEVCAAFGIAAAKRGTVIAVPGFQTKILGFSSRFVPRAVLRRVSARTALPYIGLPPAKRKKR